MPTIHIRPNYDNINSATEKWENKLREKIIAEHEVELQNEANGNNTKCKTGVTQNGTLLTYITNNEYFIDTYAPVPEDHTLKQSRYIPSDYTEEQLIEHIKKPICDYMEKEYGGMANEEMSDELINIIVSFHREYEKHFGKRHRVLSDKAYENIVEGT